MGNAIVKYRGSRKRHSWARWFIARTLRQNKNNLISVIGQTGSGKTYSALSICEIMSKMDGVPFDIDHVVFSLRELMALINSGKLKKGSKIVFDEPQVSISAREFQSKANKVFGYVLSTFRHRNLSLLFCCPFESLLDKNTRKLFHARFITDSINTNTNMCKVKPYYLEHVDYKPTPYAKYMIELWKEDGLSKSGKLSAWYIPKPSPELIKQYEVKKLAFTDNLNRNIIEELRKVDETGNSITAPPRKETTIRKPLTKMQEKVMILMANTTATNRLEVVAKELNICIASVHKHKQFALKKGYVLAEFKEEIFGEEISK